MIIPKSTCTNVRRSIYRQLMRNDDNTWEHIHKLRRSIYRQVMRNDDNTWKHIHKCEVVHLQTANEER